MENPMLIISSVDPIFSVFLCKSLKEDDGLCVWGKIRRIAW